MSAERGTTLEILQNKAQKVARTIPRIAEYRHEGVRDLHSWEDIVNSTGRAARLSASQEVLRGFLRETEFQIESEKVRLIGLAQEDEQRVQAIRTYSNLYNEGFINAEGLSQRLGEFKKHREGSNNFERRQRAILLAEERKKQERAQRRGREYRRETTVYNSGSIETEPTRVFVNDRLRAVAVDGKEVRFEEGIEWEAFKLLANANQTNRNNPQGQYVSSREINGLVIRPNGGGISASGLIEKIRGRSEVVTRLDDFAIIEESFPLKGVIETRLNGGWTAHRLTGRVSQFNGPEKAFVPKGVSLDPTGRPKVVSIGEYSERRLAEIERIYPDVRQTVREILGLIRTKRVVRPVISSQVGSYFRNLDGRFMRRMESKHYVLPVKITRNNNNHKAYSIPDIAVMIFTKEAGRFLSSEQYTDLRKIIAEEIAREQSALTGSNADKSK